MVNWCLKLVACYDKNPLSQISEAIAIFSQHPQLKHMLILIPLDLYICVYIYRRTYIIYKCIRVYVSTHMYTFVSMYQCI